jgi:hypothetical protein
MFHRSPSCPLQAAEQRRPKVSNRQIAKTKGADDERMIRKDTAENSALAAKELKQINGPKPPAADYSAPSVAGVTAAKLIVRRDQQRQRARWMRNAKACRARKKSGVICVMIRVNEQMINTLVRLGYVGEFEDRPQVVAQAIERLIETVMD